VKQHLIDLLDISLRGGHRKVVRIHLPLQRAHKLGRRNDRSDLKHLAVWSRELHFQSSAYLSHLACSTNCAGELKPSLIYSPQAEIDFSSPRECFFPPLSTNSQRFRRVIPICGIALDTLRRRGR